MCAEAVDEFAGQQGRALSGGIERRELEFDARFERPDHDTPRRIFVRGIPFRARAACAPKP